MSDLNVTAPVNGIPGFAMSKPAAKLKPAAPKKVMAPKKAAPKKEPAERDRSMSDVPASERRLALVKLLRKHKATSGATAIPLSVIAGKLGYTTYDVYCLSYHKFPLARDGFVKTANREDSKETLVYLTAKGVKNDPE